MIGDKVRALREGRSWSQSHLADAAGLSPRTIQRLEAKHSCSPETLLCVAGALGTDVRALLGETGEAGAHRALFALEPDRAALWGLLLAAPSLLFVAVNLLKYGLGIAGPSDLASRLITTTGAARALEAVSPLVLLGGPAIALLLGLTAQVTPMGSMRGPTMTLTGLAVRPSRPALLVMAVAGAALACLLTYLVGENAAAFLEGHRMR